MVLKPKLQFAFILLFSATIIYFPIIVYAQTPIDCGQTITGSISTAGEKDSYSFTGSVGDVVTIRVKSTPGGGYFTPYLELYNPSGALVVGAMGQIDRTLAAAGTYTLVVRDNAYVYTGNYTLTWQRMNNPCALEVSCGQVTTGSISTSDPFPQKYYSFQGLVNDAVTIRVTKTSGNLIPYLELYGPTGGMIVSGTSQLDKTLTETGVHKIVVRDQNNINIGGYLLIWQRINNPCNATNIACGKSSLGSVSMGGEIDAYTLTAEAGDNIQLTLTKTPGWLDPSLELYNSSGTRLAYQYTSSGNQVAITQMLSVGGSYTVFVSDYGNDEPGNYELNFQKNNNACSDVVLITPNGGEKIVVRSTLIIRWTWTSPQGISSQEVKLSTDGGLSFPNVLATGLTGDVKSFNWDVPSDMVTNQGRIRITVTGNSGVITADESDADFTIFQGVGTTYVYDELNRLFQIIYEDGKRATYNYDAVGNLLNLNVE